MRTMTRRMVLAVGLATGAVGGAAAEPGDWNLLVNGRAIHVDASREWNENNVGLGIEREFDSGAPGSRWVKLVMANGYRDSDERMAYMAGGGLKRRFELGRVASEWHVDLGVVGFLMTREDVDNNRAFPGALPVLTVGNGDFAVNMTYFPTSVVEDTIPLRVHDDTVDGVMFFQFSFRLGMFGRGDGRGGWLAANGPPR